MNCRYTFFKSTFHKETNMEYFIRENRNPETHIENSFTKDNREARFATKWQF